MTNSVAHNSTESHRTVEYIEEPEAALTATDSDVKDIFEIETSSVE
jgi:hypothetical protein